MLAHQSAGFRAQFEDGKAGRIVHKDGSVVEHGHTAVKLSPLVRRQIAATELLAADFAHIHHKTLHQLLVGHFKAEHGNGGLHVHGHLLHHGDNEGRLSHCRTCGNDDEVAVLPSARHAVKLVKARAESAKAVGARRGLLQEFVHTPDDGIDLRILLLQVVLADFKHTSLNLLHQVGHVHCGVEGHRLHEAAEGYQLTGKILLRHNLGVIHNVRAACHVGAELQDVGVASGLFFHTIVIELFVHRDNVHGSLFHVERLYSPVNELMTMVIETLGLEQLANLRIGFLLNHERAKNGRLHVKVLGLFMT